MPEPAKPARPTGRQTTNNDSKSWAEQHGWYDHESPATRSLQHRRQHQKNTALANPPTLCYVRPMISQGRKWVAEWLEGLGRLALLTQETIASLFTLKVAWKDLLYQIYFVGVKSQSVVLITGAF